MINPIDMLYFVFSGAVLVTMALGIGFSAFMPSLDRWNKRYFITLFSLLFLCAVTCLLALIFWYDPAMAETERVVYLFESTFLSVPTFMPTVFLLHCCGESIKKSPLFKAVTALLGAYLIMVIITHFTDVFSYVTPDNQFFRGPLWALGLAPMVAVLILNIVGVIRRRKKLSRKYFAGLLIYLVPMTLAALLHLFTSVELFVVFGMALFALIMFGLILSDNVEQYANQQRQIANQRAGIMVLQMRPHFIYNTMTGIYYLCDQDPEKAKKVTLDFTTYLRKNFAAIASEDTIPFTDELEHTRAYLAVEQAQFEDTLFVSFDTPYTAFRVPPLTLQPIVENAVKHGMRSSSDPIHVSVVTRKTDKYVEIVVEDDGPGFGAADDNEPHIALNNIRGRLEMMCRGELQIAARGDGGTSVTVRIPTDRDE